MFLTGYPLNCHTLVYKYLLPYPLARWWYKLCLWVKTVKKVYSVDDDDDDNIEKTCILIPHVIVACFSQCWKYVPMLSKKCNRALYMSPWLS